MRGKNQIPGYAETPVGDGTSVYSYTCPCGAVMAIVGKKKYHANTFLGAVRLHIGVCQKSATKELAGLDMEVTYRQPQIQATLTPPPANGTTPLAPPVIALPIVPTTRHLQEVPRPVPEITPAEGAATSVTDTRMWGGASGS